MAYLKIEPVSNPNHLIKLLDYVSNENKTMERQLVTCSGCLQETCYSDFMDVKNVFEKTEGLLAHQLIQSFKVGEISPTKAHEIGVRLAEAMLTGYQYTVNTHTDQDHVHTHIVLNSVNSITGEKFHSNKKTLSAFRAYSDILCKENKLSIIEKSSGMRGIDKTTYELASKGKSWKIQLASILDDVIVKAKDKNEFIVMIEEKGYSVNYQNTHITIQKNGEKKGIRVDTLAKQFGAKYTKENIERVMRGEAIQQVFEEVAAPTLDGKDTEFMRVEKYYFETRYKPKHYTRKPKDLELSTMLKLERSMKNSRSFGKLAFRKMAFESYVSASDERKEKFNNFKDYIKSVEQKKHEKYLYMCELKEKNINSVFFEVDDMQAGEKFGNISYRELMKSAGENITIVLNQSQINKLKGSKVFYTGIKQSNGKCKVTFKKTHENKISKLIGVDLQAIKVKGQSFYEQQQYKSLQLRAFKEEKTLCQFIMSHDELLKLDNQNIVFSAFKKGKEEYKVHFYNDDLYDVCKLLNKDYIEERRKNITKENNRLYMELKEISKIEKQPLTYREVTSDFLDELKEANIKIAVFPKEDYKYSVAFLHSDLKMYNQELENYLVENSHERTFYEAKENARLYAEIKQVAKANDEDILYRVVNSDVLNFIKKKNIPIAVFSKEDNFNISFLIRYKEAYEKALKEYREHEYQEQERKRGR